MNHDNDLERIEGKLDGHIKIHDEDSKKLLWWVIGILITVILSAASGFIAIGKDEEKINNLELNQPNYVTKNDLNASVGLLNLKFETIDRKMDAVLKALGIPGYK